MAVSHFDSREYFENVDDNFSRSGRERQKKIQKDVVRLLDYLKCSKHKDDCSKSDSFLECSCLIKILDELMIEFRKLPEKQIIIIFENDITKCFSREDDKRVFHKLVLKFLDLCKTNKYIELARSILQVNLPADVLKEYLTESFTDISDSFTALIISSLDSETVQQFFYKEQGQQKDNKIHKIIKERHETLIAMLDKLEGQDDKGENIQNKYFEMDRKGFTPTDVQDYNFFCLTLFQKIVFEKNKEAISHKSVHCLTNMKWKQWCRRAFTISAIIYLVSVIMLVFVAILSVNAPNVRSYHSPEDYIRAVFEIILLINAGRVLGIEIYQIVRLGKGYLVDKMNIFEIVAPILMLLVCLIRYLHEQAHWFLFAAAYLAWLLQVVKYAFVFKSTGVYVDSLWKMISVTLKFGVLVAIVITIYSGTFVLVLKGENTLDLHKETSTFFRVVLIGLRVMIETESIVDYIGDDGYNPVGVIVMMFFMFFIIVVLLNVLIAELINAYQTIENSSIKRYYVGRALIVARLEREQLPFIFNNDEKRRQCFEKAVQAKDELPDSPEMWFEDQIKKLRDYLQNKKDK